MTRDEAVDALYTLLDVARSRCGGYHRLADATRPAVATQGVYFFFDAHEPRAHGDAPRVIRIGTHAVSTGSRQTLAARLRQHRGTQRGASAGGGNHRASVFRRHVGTALIARDGWPDAARTWAKPLPAGERPSPAEHTLEQAVSAYIGDLPYVWVPAAGDAGPTSVRARLERGAIALLSNHRRSPIDPPSPDWLGRYAAAPAIGASGLWNVRHIDDPWTTTVIDLLTTLT